MSNNAANASPSAQITLFTIGFAGKTAKEFFETLKQSGVAAWSISA